MPTACSIWPVTPGSVVVEPEQGEFNVSIVIDAFKHCNEMLTTDLMNLA